MDEEKSIQKQEDMGVIICLLGLLVVLIVILAGIAMMGGDDDDDDEEQAGNQAYVDLLSVHVTDEIEENQEDVRSLAALHVMAPACENGSAQDIGNANAALDLFKETYDMTVCYLMNESGVTIASSNRNTNGSFVGNNYGFRPYFQDAMVGNQGSYFAVGVTSGTRGYYASYPVMNDTGVIVGVTVVKNELDYIEAVFTGEGISLLVSPQGIIFLSSDSDLILMSLWELEQSEKDDLVVSKEFGEGPFDAMFNSQPEAGKEVKYAGDEYEVIHKALQEDGWAVYYLAEDD